MSLVTTIHAIAPADPADPADPAAGHTYALPVVRELPRPAPSGSGGW
jgi:hypothetical protein